MLSKNKMKFIRSLHQAKFREMHKLFLAEGPKVVHGLIHSKYRIKTIAAHEDWINTHHNKLSTEIEVIPVSQKELERISTLKTPNEILAVVEIPENVHPDPDATIQLILVLDEIRDPGNMGTILRTADWFGIPRVMCSRNCVDIYNPKVVQAAMGSIARVDVIYLDLIDLLHSQPDKIPVYGAQMDGMNIYSENLTAHGFLLIGSESHGISEKLKPYITHPVSIPSYSDRHGIRAESLNASIATAILCAEFRRRSK
jgi:TrmH family RNA methyltransferase